MLQRIATSLIVTLLLLTVAAGGAPAGGERTGPLARNIASLLAAVPQKVSETPSVQPSPLFQASAAPVAGPEPAGPIVAAHDWTKTVPPGDPCGTTQHFVAELLGSGADPADAGCPLRGPCDDPWVRSGFMEDPPLLTVRLSIHVFCLNNGQDCAATQEDVDAAMITLNDAFGPYGFQFICETNFIRDSKYRYLDISSEASAMKFEYADSPASKLNVYVVDTATAVSFATFAWSAYALDWPGGIVIHAPYFVIESVEPTILTHEVGHCLGLWHTFHGVDEVEPCDDCYETAGSPPEERDLTGDLCADTNPTPKNLNNCDDPLELDPCSGNPWLDTPYINYMGYGHFCRTEFTPQQAGRMHCWTHDVLSGWLDLPGPPDAPGAPNLTKIGGGQIRITWSDNSDDEDGFEVEREKKAGGSWIERQIIADVAADITSTIDAPGPGTFHYRVRAYNSLGSSDWSSWTQIKN